MLGGGRSGSRIDALARSALLASLALGTAGAVTYAVVILMYPWDWIGGEAVNLAHSARLAEGEPLYRGGLESGALGYPIYPPAIYLVWAGLIEVFGTELWPMRLLECASAVAVAVCGWHIARWEGCGFFGRAVSGLAAFTFDAVVLLVPAARPDMLAIGVLAVGTAVAARWESRPDRIVWALVPLSVVLVFTKHNFAPFVLAWLLAVAWRDRDLGVRLTVATALAGVATLVVAQLLTDGDFLRDMRAFSAGFSGSALSFVVKSALLPVPNPILVIGGVEACVRLASRTGAVPRAPALAYFAGIAVVLTGVKLGSSLNYWAPAAVTAAYLTGPALSRLQAAGGVAVRAAACLALAAMLLPGTLDRLSRNRAVSDQTRAAEPLLETAAGRIAASSGPLLADRHDLALRARTAEFFDPPPFSIALQEGQWDSQPLTRAIAGHRFPLVETTFDVSRPTPRFQTYPLWPEPVVAAIRRHYCVDWRARFVTASGDGVWLHKPC